MRAFRSIAVVCTLSLAAAAACGTDDPPAQTSEPASEPTDDRAPADAEPPEPEREPPEPDSDSAVDDADRAEVLAAANAARVVYGLDESRTESAVDEELWRSRFGVFAHDDEVPELERRHNVNQSAASVIDDFRDHHPETFGGGWIDPDSGDLVLATTDENTASTFLDGIDPDLRSSVRIVHLAYTQSELDDLRATVEAHLLGPDGFTPGVGYVFIDPRQNAVVVGVVEGADEEHARAAIDELDPPVREGVIVITTGDPSG